MDIIKIYISKDGNDSYDGLTPEIDSKNKKGPLATLSGAKRRISDMKNKFLLDSPVEVIIKEGEYFLTEPLRFFPDDSWHMTWKADNGAKVVINGGIKITGLKEETVNGIKMWTTVFPEVASKKEYYTQLFVNGERRDRTKYPSEGFFNMGSVPGLSNEKGIFETGIFHGSDTFYAKKGDLMNFKNFENVQVVVPHLWTQERMPIKSLDIDTGRVESTHKSVFTLLDDGPEKKYSRYYFENVFEQLKNPGNWYLDSSDGKFYYIPKDGEKIADAELIFPIIPNFIKIEGKPEADKFVENIHFEGITFKYGSWYLPSGSGALFRDGVLYASSGQSANFLPGAISMRGAKHCSVKNCKILHCGFYGIDLQHGCRGIKIIGNEIGDTGGGGIKQNGISLVELMSGTYTGNNHRQSDEAIKAVSLNSLITGSNIFTNNKIYSGGRVFLDAMGIVSMHAGYNDISHNEISDYYQTGISCGWVWGDAPNISIRNKISKNHIYNIGQRESSDMGGIYTLGVQPGTIISGNVIHDIYSYDYGGWGIYPDEGSAHMLIENNIVYNTKCACFSQHYGDENVVRNNILAFGGEGHSATNRKSSTRAFTFERNIVITDDSPVFIHGYAAPLADGNILTDLNLFWDINGKAIYHGNAKRPNDGEGHRNHDKAITFEDWQKLGFDTHSIVADPLFKDAKNYDFTLSENSPAFKIGFTPIDISDVGPQK